MEVGDKFVVVDTRGAIFSNGSIVELERIEEDGHHLMKLLTGECEYEISKHGKGGFLNFKYLQPLPIDRSFDLAEGK